jgi:hypothetical protein
MKNKRMEWGAVPLGGEVGLEDVHQIDLGSFALL